MDKKLKKHIDKECHFCLENNYSLLDVHRIKPGAEGGKYTKGNTITVCSNCHRKIHSGIIKIEGKYLTTKGCHVVHYIENGQEQWK